MDQNTQLKPRTIEQPAVYSQRKMYASAAPQLQRQGQIGKFFQYVTKVEQSQPSHQPLPQKQQQQQQLQIQQQEPMMLLQQQIPPQPAFQAVQYEYYDPPMTLNAWTQTCAEDFPSIQPLMNPKVEAALLAKIQELERSLRAQSEELEELKKRARRSTTPGPSISHPATINPPEIKHESTTYTILTQSDEANCDAQIEIEISDVIGDCDSSPKLYTVKSASQPVVPAPNETEALPKRSKPNQPMTTIGPYDTQIPTEEFSKISWTSASIATRKLLTTIFDRETLATHSMTGKASPAFKDLNKPVKGRLDPNAIQDIVHIVSQKCCVSAKEVRSAITTKCADENKMLKLKELKKTGSQTPNRGTLRECNKRKSSDKENY